MQFLVAVHEDAGGNLVRSGLQKRSSPVRACPKPSPGTSRPTLQARATKGAIGRACGGSPPVPNEPLPATVCGGLARWKRVNRFWQLLPSSPFFPRQMTSTCNTATFHTEVRLQHPVQQGDLFPRSGLWRYRAQALDRRGGADRTPDATTREWLQGLPRSPDSEHEFHSAWEPAWHCSVARFLLCLVLVQSRVARLGRVGKLPVRVVPGST